MPGGIDIEAETVVVATPDGTTRHRNAISAIADPADVEDSSLTFQHRGTQYAIGTAAEHAGDGDSDAVERLFGGQQDAALAGRAFEALLAAVAGTPHGTYGYVDRDAAILETISDPTADREFEILPVDPGMAVCYEAFDDPPSGLGVVLGDGRAFGTLAVEGVPVATATVTYEGQWYDVTDAVEDVSTDGVRAAWNRGQYGAVLGVLAAELAERAPSVAGPLAVALGGSDAPRGLTAADLRLAGEALGVTIDAVAVADRPEETPARGALAATRVGERSGPVPAFAATDEYARGRVDIEGATDALAGVVEDADAPSAATTGGTAAGRNGTSAREGTRHESGVGPALAGLAGQLDAETGRLDRLFDDIDETVASVEADLADLDEQTPSGERVSELEATVEQTAETLGELTDDVSEIQAVLAGLDDESLDGADASGAYESVAADALQDDLESVESALSGRIETIWEEIDGINDELVDLSARLGDLPELEDDLESTRASVEDLTEQTGQLRQSLATLRDRVDETEDRMATTDDVASVADELERVGGELDEVRTRLREADWVEPAQLDAQARDLDALRETVLDHARRLEGVERTTSDLDDRLEQTFRNTAKAEALSSLQTEVSRLQSSVAGETDAGAGTEAVADLDERIQALEERVRSLDDRLSGAAEEFDQLRSTVDSVAERSVTRSELDEQTGTLDARTSEALDEFDARLTAIENSGVQGEPAGTGSGFARLLLSVALVSAAGLGAMLALVSDQPDVAAGFVVLVAGPAVLLWVTQLDL